jgi:dihydroorotate dehydrogenase
MGLLYEKVLRPIAFRMDPELAHDRACSALRIMSSMRGMCRFMAHYNQNLIKPVKLFGLDFPNRVGLAAGMDKNGEFPAAAAAFGFGHIEVGTVTPAAQPGNPRPRLFRYPQYGAVVNRMGFNNQGAEAMSERLARNFPRGKRLIPLGINIGKAKATQLEQAVEDYLICFRRLGNQADYFTINVSSPNTSGLRDLQTAEHLDHLLYSLQAENLKLAKKLGHAPHPLLLKIAPDLSYREIDFVLEKLLQHSFAGIVATNTTIARPNGIGADEKGGLSGLPLAAKSNAIINYIHKSTQGRLPIIGVGGVDTPESAGAKLDAGAQLVQIYTSWIYRGPFHAAKLARALNTREKLWI